MTYKYIGKANDGEEWFVDTTKITKLGQDVMLYVAPESKMPPQVGVGVRGLCDQKCDGGKGRQYAGAPKRSCPVTLMWFGILTCLHLHQSLCLVRIEEYHHVHRKRKTASKLL